MKQFFAAAAVFAASASAIPVWQQCGGINWSGSGTCDSGSTCVVLNDCELQSYGLIHRYALLTPWRLLSVPARCFDDLGHQRQDDHDLESSHLDHHHQPTHLDHVVDPHFRNYDGKHHQGKWYHHHPGYKCIWQPIRWQADLRQPVLRLRGLLAGHSVSPFQPSG